MKLRRPSPSMCVALVALFVALSGTSYAAVTLKRNSVGSKQIRSGAVGTSEVRDRSLRARDFRAGQLPSGAGGATGATGPQGKTGARGPRGSRGVTGATGPQGPAGAVGAAGAPGGTGPQGPSGVSEVKSATFAGQALTGEVAGSKLTLGAGTWVLVATLRSGAGASTCTLGVDASPVATDANTAISSVVTPTAQQDYTLTCTGDGSGGTGRVTAIRIG